MYRTYEKTVNGTTAIIYASPTSASLTGVLIHDGVIYDLESSIDYGSLRQGSGAFRGRLPKETFEALAKWFAAKMQYVPIGQDSGPVYDFGIREARIATKLIRKTMGKAYSFSFDALHKRGAILGSSLWWTCDELDAAAAALNAIDPERAQGWRDLMREISGEEHGSN